MSAPRMLLISDSRPTMLANSICPYCGKPVSRRSGTREHVIGRRFVPRGSFEGCWNLILKACRQCNHGKSDLEDDLSAITMAFHVAGLAGMNDDLLKKEAERKSKRSISRKTGKPVSQSAANVSFEVPIFSGASITGNFTSPPQIDDARAHELARLQLMGFFYMLTYDTTANRGYWWRGGFYPLHGTIKSDWGNPVHRAFMSEIAGWDYRLIVTTADGYFRAVIRKHPTDEFWGWAVEWNDCYRLVGFFGSEASAIAVANRMPKLQIHSMLETERSWLRYRIETALADEEDILFRLPDNA